MTNETINKIVLVITLKNISKDILVTTAKLKVCKASHHNTKKIQTEMLTAELEVLIGLLADVKKQLDD